MLVVLGFVLSLSLPLLTFSKLTLQQIVFNLKGMVWARYLFTGKQNRGHLVFIDF